MGRDTAIDVTHDFGIEIDSNKFLNQKSLAVFFDDYVGKITRNYFFANSCSVAVQVSAQSGFDPNSIIVEENTIEGYFAVGHIVTWPFPGPDSGWRIIKNKLITGNTTLRSPFGLITYVLASHKFLVRRNVFSGFDSAAILSRSAHDDFGTSNDSGKNVFLLPCKPTAKAIIRTPSSTVNAIGNWYGTSNPDSNTLFYPVDKVNFRPYDTLPRIPFLGKLGRTSTWAAGNDTLIGDFTLDSCATPVTLTLNPGVQVLAAANQDVMRSGRDTTKTEFIVKGTLTALGTQTDSIKFLSSSSSPTKMDWGGLFFSHPARGNFAFTQFSHADTILYVRDTCTVKVRNSKFSDFRNLAIYTKSKNVNLGVAPTDCGKNNVLMKTAELPTAKAVWLDTLSFMKAEGNYWDSVPPPAAWFTGDIDIDPYLSLPATPISTCPTGGGGGGCGGPGNGPCAKITVVDDSRPSKFELAQNYPNPFNAATVIRFALPQATRVELRIYNILGQAVRTFVDEKPSGLYEVFWDGRDENGAAVSSGIYLYQIRAGSYVETKKMQLVK